MKKNIDVRAPAGLCRQEKQNSKHGNTQKWQHRREMTQASPSIPSGCFFPLAVIIAFWKRERTSRTGGFYG
ncbi:hypothetical protein HNO84_16035 [Herbaspirillum robiniae]|uniref:Uncharacterized protein n=2 Tax=Herbaspirillum robiniae TaxID=2014887 RepID=A0ABX2M152_9BURK|nr:hypothetical protein [Herbaspirillum robiniae]